MIHINHSFYTKVNLKILCNKEDIKDDLSIILPTIKNQDQWRKIEKIILEYENIMYYRWCKLTYLYDDFVNNWELYHIIRHNYT